jgi:hypothetical protein
MQIAHTKWALSVRNLPDDAFRILPLKHLYCHPDDLFTSKPVNPHSLSNITHLELFNGLPLGQWDQTRSGLAALPRLTHLALNEPDDMPWYAQILLDTCKSIRALIAPTTHQLLPKHGRRR